MKRAYLLAALMAALCASGAADAGEAPAPTAAVTSAPEQAATEQSAPEPYDVTTLLATARFDSRPRIDVYNYLLGDNVCRLAEYCLTDGESECVLITLTLPEELTAALADCSWEDMASILRMSLDALESLGFVLDAGEARDLYGRPLCVFDAYTSERALAGWATMDARQAQFVLATGDEAGYRFLSSVTSRRELAFAREGSAVSFGGVTLTFPYTPEVEGASAVSENALTHLSAELIPLSDITMLSGADAEELLHSCVPEGAADVSTQALGSVSTMLYAYDSEALGRPLQGRLMLLEGCILRMEATFDNAGDAFMNDVYVAAD